MQSIEVGGRLLSVMASAGRALMLRDIAAGAEVAPAQAHAYLVSLRKIGLVEQNATSGLYQLGSFALQLGLARLRSLDALRLTGEAVVGLAAELGLMVTVTVWGSFGATIVQVQEGTDQIHVNLRAGAVYSLTGTATGRVFGAFLPQALVAAHLAAEKRDGSAGQKVGESAAACRFARDVAETRQQGYATALGSPIPGVNAVSAPVFDHTGQIQLAITVIGPAKLMGVEANSVHTRRLLAFTGALSAELGFDGGGPRATPEQVRPVTPAPGKAARKRRALAAAAGPS